MVRVSRFMLGFGLMAGLFGFVPAQAAILYVDKDNGCPGTGTSQAPYCRIQNAFNVASAGESFRLDAGDAQEPGRLDRRPQARSVHR